MNLIWAFLPDEALVLVIVAIGFGLMVGIIRVRTAASLLGGLFLITLLGPFVEMLFESLPSWLTLMVLALICLSLLRAFLGLVLGRRASDHVVGILAADVVRFCFVSVLEILFLPFRMIGRLIRREY